MLISGLSVGMLSTAGPIIVIGIGILVAESLGLPFVYVRPEPKKHGRQNQVEGFL